MGVRAGRALDVLRVAGDGLLDFLYPPRCAVCGAWDAPPVCERCADAFFPIPEPFCGRCSRPLPPGGVCATCAAAEKAWGGWAFDTLVAGGVYGGPLRHAVHQVKYRGMRELGPILGEHLAARCVSDGLLPEPGQVDLVLPVPGEPGRMRRRGYNPPALIAAPLADALRCPLADPASVVRAPGGAAQMGRSPEQRRRAMESLRFDVGDGNAIAGCRVLLVDDVFTTGATLQALARRVRSAGAARIDAVALAAGG